MIKDVKVDGSTMTITVGLVKGYQSKTALAKAEAKGIGADKVPANNVASSGGFARWGQHRINLNVLTA